jgi:transposase
MAYFLKVSKQKNRTYLAIYESFYDHGKKDTAHRCHKPLQSVETHIANGIEDPIAHFQKEVDELNRQKDEAGVKKISDVSPVLYMGYFPLKSIMEKMNIEKYVDYFKLTNDFCYDPYEHLSSLVYARSVKPCSKWRTFYEVLPNLYHTHGYSYDQLLSGLSFLGYNYEKFVEIFTVRTKEVFGIDTSKTYFDCTNFYFEIDREDDFRRKGKSKENRRNPLVGLGLLLDANQIPIGMQLYPGNESETTKLREVVNRLKEQNGVTGRTIHVADKGLNSANNIAYSKSAGDGYLFSKSVKGLPATEKTWITLDNGAYKEKKDRHGKVQYYYKSCVDKFPYKVEHEGKETTVFLTEKRLATYNPDLAAKKRYEINKMVEKIELLTLSKAKKKEYGDAGKYVNFTDGQGGKATVAINQKAIEEDLKLAGYNLLVTSEIKMSDLDMYDVYHNLWRIEESFKIMKSELDARPAFVQKEGTIKGHFLICYLSVLLERILQVKVLENKYSTSEIYGFMKNFKATNAERKYINTTTNSVFINDFATLSGLPLTHYYLSETQMKSIFNYKLNLASIHEIAATLQRMPV